MLVNSYAFGPGAPSVDPDAANVVSLLKFQGSNGSTTFTDDTGRTWTAQGDAQIATDATAAAGVSGTFDGTGDYLTASTSTDFDFGTGEFCVEAFVKPSAIPGPGVASTIVGKWNPNFNWIMVIDTNGALGFYFTEAGGGAQFPHGTNGQITAGNWYHVAVYKLVNNIRMAVNGVTSGTTGNSLGIQATGGQALAIAADAVGGNRFAGQMQGVRVTKGVSRYGTSNFSPPSPPFPNLV